MVGTTGTPPGTPGAALGPQIAVPRKTPSALYIDLPLAGSKSAPKTFKGKHRSLNRFLSDFKYVCVQGKVTDDEQKCLGLLRYCEDDIADFIETLDPYAQKDYDALEEELRWLYDADRKKSEFHLGDIGKVTESWRREENWDLKLFKQYQREFQKVAGPLKKAGLLDDVRFDDGFWGGFNQETRDRLERRMMDQNSSLDPRKPFEHKDVVDAAKYIFNRNRFDKHLREGRATTRPSGERPGKKSKTRKTKKYESDSEETETEEEEPTPRWRRDRSIEKPKPAIVVAKPEITKEKADRDEINELVRQMEGLSVRGPGYRANFVKLQLLAPGLCEYYEPPPTMQNRNYVAQEVRFQPPEQQRRDPPPHQSTPPPDQRFVERREPMICYGCGGRGHRIDQCGRIEAYIRQGVIARFDGRLRWADGSNIFRESNDTWADAIAKRVHQDKGIKGTDDKAKGIYYVEIARDDSDAETEDQEKMGWKSGGGSIGHLQAYGVDRNTKVSKEARREVQGYLPPKAHRMKEFTPAGHFNGPMGKQGVVPKDLNVNRGQHRLKTTPSPTPIDVAPHKFEGKLDHEFVPMDVEEALPRKRSEDGRKGHPRDAERTTREVTQGRAKRGKVQAEITKGLMDLRLTMSLQEVACIAPSVRRDLAGVLKAMRDDPDKEDGTRVGMDSSKAINGGVKALKAEEMPTVHLGSLWKREARSELLKLEARIGNATMTGIVDTGSMVNMISQDKLEESGLPSVPLKGRSFRVTGMNGSNSRCKSWIPKATIYLTPENLVTTGELYVLENADFELLLGRPWGTLNGAGIAEKRRGTHVSWISGVQRHEVNVSKANQRPTVVEEIDVDLCQADTSDEGTSEGTDDEDGEGVVPAYAVRAMQVDGTDRSYVPDSVETKASAEFFQDQGRSEDDEQAAEVNRRAHEKVKQWNQEDADDEGDGKGVMWSPPPNQQDKGKGRAWDEGNTEEEAEREAEAKGKGVSEAREEIIEIGQDLEEEIIQMVSNRATDEDWDEFCGKERSRLVEKDRQWHDWKEEIINLYLPSEPLDLEAIQEEESMEEREIPVVIPTREPSHTLRTPPPETTKPAKKRKMAEPSQGSEITARRSLRTRRRTEKGIYADREKEKRRTYVRTEKIAKEVSIREGCNKRTRREQEEEEEPKIFSFCAIIPNESDEEDEPVNTAPRKASRTLGRPHISINEGVVSACLPTWSRTRQKGVQQKDDEEHRAPTETNPPEAGPRSKRRPPNLPNIQVPSRNHEGRMDEPLVPRLQAEQGDIPHDDEQAEERTNGRKERTVERPQIIKREGESNQKQTPSWFEAQQDKALRGIYRQPGREDQPMAGPLEPEKPSNVPRDRKPQSYTSGIRKGRTIFDDSSSDEEPIFTDVVIDSMEIPAAEKLWLYRTRHTMQKIARDGPSDHPATASANTSAHERLLGNRTPGQRQKMHWAKLLHAPELDPYTALQRIRAEEEKKALDASLLSAQEDTQTKEEDIRKQAATDDRQGEDIPAELKGDNKEDNKHPEAPKEVGTMDLPVHTAPTQPTNRKERTSNEPGVPNDGKEGRRRAIQRKKKDGDLRRTMKEHGTTEQTASTPQDAHVTTADQEKPIKENDGSQTPQEAAQPPIVFVGSVRLHDKQTEVEQGPRGTDEGSKTGVCKRVSPKTIKTRKGRSKGPHLTSWLPTRLPPVRSVETPWKLQTLLLLLTSLALGAMLIQYSSDPQPAQDTKAMTYLQGLLLNESRPTTRRSGSFGDPTMNPDEWTSDSDRPVVADQARERLRTLGDPAPGLTTPAIIAIQHCTVTTSTSLPPTHEYLGQGAVVSIRLPNGRTDTLRGDVHIRVFVGEGAIGRVVATPPSRTEVNHLRGILFQENGYDGWMKKIKRVFEEGVRLKAAAKIRMEKEGGGEGKGRGEDEKEDPTNVPTAVIKYGPPPPSTKLGKGSRPSTAQGGEQPPAEVVRVKEEEREDDPVFRFELPEGEHMPLLRIGDPATSRRAVTLGPPPELDYPAQHTSIDNKKPSVYDQKVERIITDQIEFPACLTYQATTTDGKKKPMTRTQDEALVEIVDVLKKLHLELGAALSLEIGQMISNVESDAGRLLEAREGKRKVSKDRDGDVEMGGNTHTPTLELVPVYQSPVPMTSQSAIPPYEEETLPMYRLEEVEGMTERTAQEMREFQWKAVGEEVKTDDRFCSLEARVATLEAMRLEEGEPGATRRSPRQQRNDQANPRLATRPQLQRVEAKAETAKQEAVILKIRMGEIEEAGKQWDELRRKVNGLDVQAGSLEGEAMAVRRKVADLEIAWKEGSLRHELASRDVQGRNILSSGILPRVSQIETRLLRAEYRITTTEQQVFWGNEKSAAIYATITAPTPAEAVIRAHAVQVITDNALSGLSARLQSSPSYSAPSSSSESSTHGTQTAPNGPVDARP